MKLFEEILKDVRNEGWTSFILEIEGGNVIYYDDMRQQELHATNKKQLEKELPLFVKTFQLKLVEKDIDYTKIASIMKKERKVKKHTKKDVDMIIHASEMNDWKEVHKSVLYNDFSGHYCSLLSVLCELNLLGELYEVI